MESLNVLVYGDINLNVIDGSAVWLTSMLNVLSVNENISIDLLLKAKINNTEMVESIYKYDSINTIEMFKTSNRLTVEEAVSNINELNEEKRYDCIILRGFQLCKLATTHKKLQSKLICYVTDFEHDEEVITDEEKQQLKLVYDNCKFFCAQTPEARESIKRIIDVKEDEKFIILNPMIPNYTNTKPDFANRNNKLIYSGKFAKDWNTKEIIESFDEIYEENCEIYLNVVGKVFRQDLNEDREYILNILQNNNNVSWIQGVNRNRSNELIDESDLGIAWRSEKIDNDKSVELSTKVLEYCRAGKPILLNRIKMYEKLLGKDYPLFVDSKEDFKNKIKLVLSDEILYRKCAKCVYEVGKKYTFLESYKRLHSKLWGFKSTKTKILFAGHDLKFLNLFINYISSLDNYEVKIDQWSGHTTHNVKNSTECLNWADVIFCEWGLGNAVWYSQNKKQWQKLIVRMHGQERNTKYAYNFNYDNIDQIIAISPYIYELFANKINVPRSKMKIVYNYLDFDSLNKEKFVGSEFNLGIVGICPRLKRLDIALDLLSELVKKDNRYKLFVKGKQPEEYPWIMNRPAEKAYYDDLYSKITNLGLEEHVIFDGHGNDMEEWFRKIGFILSTSDFESFHLAPAEGMCSGTIPVIRNWEGSNTIYSEEYIFESIDKAVELILKGYSNEDKERYSNYVCSNFDKENIFSEIVNIIQY